MTNIFSRAEVSEFFDRMDRDFDGRLSFGEFMGEETPLEKVFKNMDKDGDGSVSKEVRIELRHIFSSERSSKNNSVNDTWVLKVFQETQTVLRAYSSNRRSFVVFYNHLFISVTLNVSRSSLRFAST